jgi:nucleoside-diphosphate-sugar epimerase
VSDRVVVLGANGFIGKRVVAALQASGWARPVIATRREVPAPDGVEKVRVDATDEKELARAFEDATGVVNCVAGNATTILANARALFAAANRCAVPPRVVYLSSMAVYGSATGTVDESAPLLAPGDAYGTSKIAAERLAASCPSAVVLRPGIVYGPHSDWWSVQIARLLCQKRLGDLGENGQGLCNLLYVEDMAQAALQALRREEVLGRSFNLAMSDPPTWNEYFALYAQALGAAPERRISSARLATELRVIGPALKLLELAPPMLQLSSSPSIRPWLIRLTRHRIRLEVAAAERLLGMRWAPLDKALATTAGWFLGWQARAANGSNSS